MPTSCFIRLGQPSMTSSYKTPRSGDRTGRGCFGGGGRSAAPELCDTFQAGDAGKGAGDRASGDARIARRENAPPARPGEPAGGQAARGLVDPAQGPR